MFDLQLGMGSGCFACGPQLLQNADFSSWTLDNPDNWVIFSSPEIPDEEYVSEGSNGGAKFYSIGGGGTIGLQQYNAGFVVDNYYLVSFTIVSHTSGVLTCQFGASDQYSSPEAVGRFSTIIQAKSTNFQMYVIGGTDLEVDNVDVRLIS